MEIRVPEPEEETTEDVEVIDRHDFQGGYFENEDGDGFIFLESDIAKCGNVGVVLGSLHIPQGCNDPDHGLVIITYDESGEVKDVKFISFTRLTDENSGALDSLLAEFDDVGLVEDFQEALWALGDLCDEKSDSATQAAWVSGAIAFVAAFFCFPVAIGASIAAFYSGTRSSY